MCPKELWHLMPVVVQHLGRAIQSVIKVNLSDCSLLRRCGKFDVAGGGNLMLTANLIPSHAFGRQLNPKSPLHDTCSNIPESQCRHSKEDVASFEIVEW